MRKLFVCILFLCGLLGLSAQETSDEKSLPNQTMMLRAQDPLSPSRAAFYSAVVPGLGQIYNKKYWKLPVVYGGMGASVYFYFNNQRKYNLFRDEYKKRLLGIHDTSDPLFGRLDNDRIIRAQRYYQRNRDLAMVITIGLYALNIIDANVDAHLQQFNVDDDLTFSPAMHFHPITGEMIAGFQCNYKF